jgi:steroid 5-alpha reductase family enzyme
MTEAGKRSLIALPIVLLIAIGLAWAGSQGGVVVSGFPLFALCVALAFIIQWIVFIPAFINQTEKFYDLTGSLTYISITLIALALTPNRDLRTVLLAGVVIIWAARLGTFLFRRVQAAGADDRFDDIKPDFPRFLLTWTLQGLWVSFTLAAALGAITAENKPEMSILTWIGLLVWVLGFGFEVVADNQKSQFRADPKNKGGFIKSGLWAWSRHPNYFGEILLWVGVAIMALPALSGWRLVTLLSPVFVYLLITRVSGVPMLEAKADKKWGGQADYEAYKASTPVLIPRPPSSSS